MLGSLAPSRFTIISGERVSFQEYWWFYLGSLLILLVALLLTTAIGSSIPYALVALGLIVPSLAVGVRRLHDTGRSGWFLLIGIIPIIGGILLIVWFATEGEASTNQYGPSPKTSDAEFTQYGS
jgi:uncharacterized membrane protein YhaH (DUF805 family)